MTSRSFLLPVGEGVDVNFAFFLPQRLAKALLPRSSITAKHPQDIRSARSGDAKGVPHHPSIAGFDRLLPTKGKDGPAVVEDVLWRQGF